MLYKGKIVANETTPMNRTIPVNVTANKIDALLARYAQPLPPSAPITTGANGTIIIPATAFSSVVNTSEGGSAGRLGTAPLYVQYAPFDRPTKLFNVFSI